MNKKALLRGGSCPVGTEHSVFYMRNRDPGLASIFSFLLPGLGQIYMGKMGWGIFHFFFQIGLFLIGLTVAFPLISTKSGLPFADRLISWLETPLNMGMAFGILFLTLANWIWSFMSAAPKETLREESQLEATDDNIAELVKTARLDFLRDASKTVETEAAPTLEEVTFAQTLSEIMDLKDIKIEDLAEITGLSIQEIARYLKGAQPDSATINIIARGLNVSPRVLLSELVR